MKIYNRKRKEWVELSQAMKEWKQGLEKVTPLQQTTITQLGYTISAVGVVWGIIFSIRIRYWWMAVILIGGIIVLSVQYLGNWQKKQILIRMEEAIRQADIEELNKEEITNGVS